MRFGSLLTEIEMHPPSWIYQSCEILCEFSPSWLKLLRLLSHVWISFRQSIYFIAEAKLWTEKRQERLQWWVAIDSTMWQIWMCELFHSFWEYAVTQHLLSFCTSCYPLRILFVWKHLFHGGKQMQIVAVLARCETECTCGLTANLSPHKMRLLIYALWCNIVCK